MKDVTSKHLRTSTELTLIAPIKQGFIEHVDTMTYASRLRLLLNVLHELRKGADERKPPKPVMVEGKLVELEYVGPLERLQTLHFVQWAVIDNDTKLMLNVTFDRSWESYIRDIVDIAGPLLDIILCHCAGYDGCSTDLGYEAFATWVRKHQVQNDFFFAAEPGLTADDNRIHKQLTQLPWQILKEHGGAADSIAGELERRASTLRVTMATATGGTLQDLQRIASVLFELRRSFSASTSAGHAPYLSPGARRNLVFFDEVAYALLEGFKKHFEAAGPTPSERLLASWYGKLEQRKRAQSGPRAGASIPLSALQDIQRGLVTPFPETTHGCLVLLQWQDPQAGAALLEKLRKHISIEGKRDDDKGTVSLALTYRGLSRLDLGEDELRGFPKEFREGMEARSGILGDVETAHPSEWQLPEANWPPPPSRAKPGARDRIALTSVDAVLLVQSSAKACGGARDYDFEWSADHPLLTRLTDELLPRVAGVRVLHVQALRREYQGKAMIEHFGFRDDVSQPHVPFERPEGSDERAVLKSDEVPPGEIVLGYPNARGEVAQYRIKGVHDPKRDLLKNGSFLVLRKLEQHVERFEAFVSERAKAIDVDPDDLKAQMMGRKPGPDGAPLTDPRVDAASEPELQALQKLNAFDFGEETSRCPFHSHIRRLNPRDVARPDKDRNLPQHSIPRILRRSFAYGPPAGSPQQSEREHERGLMFMAFNAGIADQYEILQRWVSGGNSTGLGSPLADLIAGSPKKTAFAVETKHGVRWLSPPSEPLVSLRWGLYTFVPSLKAIDILIERASTKQSEADEQKQKELGLRGLGLIGALEKLPDSVAKVEWKRLLEDRDALEDTRAIWAGVIARGGAVRTPYGVLVAGKANVYEVLKRSDTYSVREYWHRMDDSLGGMHLGMDPRRVTVQEARATARDTAYQRAVHEDEYASVAAPLNRAIYQISFEQGLDSALERSRDLLGLLPRDPKSGTVTCELRDFVAMVLQDVSARWFGMPTAIEDIPALPQDKVSSFSDFRQCSTYVFSPNPEPWIGEGARLAAKTIEAAYEHDGFKALARAKVAQAKLPSDADRFPAKTDEQLAQGLKGAAFGFLAATAGSLISAIAQWVDSGQLWRLQQALVTLGEKDADAAQRKKDLDVVQRAILGAMQRGPVPGVLHRQVVRAAQLGAVPLTPGDRVVVGLGTVPAQDPKDDQIMFGGAYVADSELTPEDSYEHGDRPVHACPGREMALGVMTGFVWTLLEQRELRRVSELSPLKLTFKP
jgi:deferrochelatase/peroxidase EfeB